MLSKQTINLDGGTYVIVPKQEYEALQTLANLPDLPEPLPNGNYPAGEFLRASIARDIIRDRVKAGLSQKDLAKLSGIRVETLCRIETGKVTPSVSSIDKIDRALKAAEAQQPKTRKAKQKPHAKKPVESRKRKA